MSETGAIKFRCERIATGPVAFTQLPELNACRRTLLQLRLVGCGADGIGFGNLSVRDDAGSGFFITGTGTGGLPVLTTNDVARVVEWRFVANSLRCEGGAVASSESLTHAAIYEASPETRAIIHFHSASLWTRLRDAMPTTSPAVEYGTPEMALEVARLFAQTDVETHRLIVMGGHPEGLVAFGGTLQAALEIALRTLGTRR